MQLTFWTVVLVLVVAAFAYQAAKKIFDFVNGIIKGIIKAPGKGFVKFINYLKGAKVARLERKKAKLVMKEDYKARLNAALRNPSYNEAKKVKKINNKLEAIRLKSEK